MIMDCGETIVSTSAGKAYVELALYIGVEGGGHV
jgi:hypothetical protein